jgi:GNAT superfamily N-acetyltransferase
VVTEREPWVVTRDECPAALLVLNDAWIDQLYVDPKWTRQGLGSVLIHVAKELNPQAVDLWKFESDLGARRFYERHGFAAIASTDDNDEGAPALHYRWSAS